MADRSEVTKDIIFQQIFGKVGNEEITKPLLEKILGIEIEEITLDVNKQQLGDTEDDKVSILDVKAKINGGTKVLIEMQVVKYPYIEQRLLYYWSRAYVGDLKKGIEYKTLDKTIAILISADNIEGLADIEKFHTKWEIREEESNEKLVEDLEIHIIELNKFKEGDKSPEADWIKFIKEGTRMEKKEGLDEGIQAAMEELDRLLANEELVKAYEAREKYLRDKISYDSWRKETTEEIQKKQKELKRDQKEMKKKQGEVEKQKAEMKKKQGEVEKQKAEMKKKQEDVEKQKEEIGKEREEIEKKEKELQEREKEVQQAETKINKVTIQKLKAKNYTIKQISELLDLEEKEVETLYN